MPSSSPMQLELANAFSMQNHMFERAITRNHTILPAVNASITRHWLLALGAAFERLVNVCFPSQVGGTAAWHHVSSHFRSDVFEARGGVWDYGQGEDRLHRDKERAKRAAEMAAAGVGAGGAGTRAE